MNVEPDPEFFPVAGPPPSDFRSDSPTHPGEVLRRELNARGLSQADLAARAGLSAKHVNQVLQGVALMSADVAIALERVLGPPASMWTRLDARWQEERSRKRDEKNLAQYIEWSRRFPLRELVQAGKLPHGIHGSVLVDSLLQLFRVASPEAFERVWLGSLQGGFKRAQRYDCDEYSTASWLLLGEHQARTLSVQSSFNVASLRRVLPQLREATQLDLVDGFRRARELLASTGVSLVFVKSMPACRASGATWWVANRPILILSERYGREDSFWFSLFHEVAHVLLHPRRMVFVEFDKESGDDASGHEAEADEFAANQLVPVQFDDVIRQAAIEDLPGVAGQVGIGVSIIAGRRGHLTREWRQVSKYRRLIDVAALQDAASRAR